MEIKVVDYIGDRATDMTQGDQIRELIEKGLNKNEQVVVNFSGLNTILSTFLNNAIGALYKNYNRDFLNSHLSFSGLGNDDLFILKRVAKRAREFYENSDKITESLNDDLLEGQHGSFKCFYL